MAELDNTITCLHCRQTRYQIKRDDTICGIVSGYEYPEVVAEWPRHRWVDWKNAELDKMGIVPEAYARYRRTPLTEFEWVSCIDTKRGHVYPKQDEPDWDWHTDRCIACGHRKDVSQDTEGETP